MLKDSAFSIRLSVHLQLVLQRLSFVGTPLYPTNSICEEALITYFCLFPVCLLFCCVNEMSKTPYVINRVIFEFLHPLLIYALFYSIGYLCYKYEYCSEVTFKMIGWSMLTVFLGVLILFMQNSKNMWKAFFLNGKVEGKNRKCFCLS